MFLFRQTKLALALRLKIFSSEFLSKVVLFTVIIMRPLFLHRASLVLLLLCFLSVSSISNTPRTLIFSDYMHPLFVVSKLAWILL